MKIKALVARVHNSVPNTDSRTTAAKTIASYYKNLKTKKKNTKNEVHSLAFELLKFKNFISIIETECKEHAKNFGENEKIVTHVNKMLEEAQSINKLFD